MHHLHHICLNQYFGHLELCYEVSIMMNRVITYQNAMCTYLWRT